MNKKEIAEHNIKLWCILLDIGPNRMSWCLENINTARSDIVLASLNIVLGKEYPVFTDELITALVEYAYDAEFSSMVIRDLAEECEEGLGLVGIELSVILKTAVQNGIQVRTHKYESLGIKYLVKKLM